MKYPFNDHNLPLKERINDLISRLTIEEKAGFIPTRNNPVERLGIPAWSFGAEGAHGFVDREGKNTTFPQTIGLAAAWDRGLMKKIGEVVGTEARCYYKMNEKKRGLAIWSPTVDLERDPRWGRTEEGYGEDPYLTSELSGEYIRSAQGSDPFYLRVSCGPKHFFANNNEIDRGSCSCFIPPRLLHEYYLVPFKNAIKNAGAVSLMTAYNEVNGIPMMLHPMLNNIVKNEWGFSGNIVTDGGDFIHTVDLHHYFETHGETLAAALKNGGDSMTDVPEVIIKAVHEALERKLIDEAEIDKHLERIFEVRFRFGQFDPPENCPYESINESDLMKDEYKELAKQAVRKSIVLLKNDKIKNDKALLPLKPESVNGKIAVMGPLANELHLDWYAGGVAYSVTPLDGLRNIYSDKIEFIETRDIISFTTDDGRPLVLIDVQENQQDVSQDTSLNTISEAPPKKTLAVGELNEKPARFYMEDWGWGVKTFTDIESGLMLEGCYARREVVPPQREPIPQELMPKNDTAVYSITATGKNNLQWFGFTLFNIVPQENGNILIKTHDNRRVAIKETGKPVYQHDDPLPVKGELFKIKIESNGLKSAEDAAKKFEHVIFFAGNDPMINGRECIDRPGLSLPSRHEEIIQRVADVNPKTILAIISGYPFTCKEIAKKIPAILWMAHGIQETGTGIADIISGAYSPAGRTPLTWYEDETQLPDIMEYDIIKGGTTYQYFGGKTLWPFGHGLSYSSFKYSDLKIDKTEAKENEAVTVSFKIKNTGAISAEEVPQVYISFKGSNFRHPLKSLKAFDRILFERDEEKTVNFKISVNELAIWDSYNNRFAVENGQCKIFVGASSEDIHLSGKFQVKGENLLPRKILKQIYAQCFDDYSNCYLHEKRGSYSETSGNEIPAVFNKEDGGWIQFKSLDFGKENFSRVSAIVRGGYTGSIELRLDKPDGLLAGTIEVPNTGDISFYPLPKTSHRRLPSWGYAESNLKKINGVHDLYFVFYGKTALWSFEFKTK